MCKKINGAILVPKTTAKLDVMTSVSERPTKAQAYCVAKLPNPRKTPPAMAIKTQGQLYCIACNQNDQNRITIRKIASSYDNMSVERTSVTTSTHIVTIVFSCRKKM